MSEMSPEAPAQDDEACLEGQAFTKRSIASDSDAQGDEDESPGEDEPQQG